MNIAILIYSDVEVLDFSGPFEVLTTANRFLKDRHNVFLVAEHRQTVRARAGFNVVPDHDFTDHPNIDVLIVPGGVHQLEMQNETLLAWLSDIDKRSLITASVCTGVFLLAQAEVLKNEQVTTHWQDINELSTLFPQLSVIENRRWLEAGKYITSGGISAGVDMSLHLVERLYTKDIADKTALQMEWRRQ